MNGKKSFLLENLYIFFPKLKIHKNCKIENFYFTHGNIQNENIPLCLPSYLYLIEIYLPKAVGNNDYLNKYERNYIVTFKVK